ncbi:MAG: hypothetical protein Q8P15_00055 [Nanoarchaeota archaeon]|nr:hypothetical protein [Nanoarchaeota archaeon]
MGLENKTEDPSWKDVIRYSWQKEKTETTKGLRNFSAGLINSAAYGYILPSTLRVIGEGKLPKFPIKPKIENENDATSYGAASVVGLIFTNLSQIFLYAHLVDKGHPEALLLPIVTNILSAGYEIKQDYNKTKKEMKDKRII